MQSAPDPIARGCAYGVCAALLFCWIPLCGVVFVCGVVLHWW